MRFTLGQAARQAGISKSYLSKLIKMGRISAERQENGEWRIDPTELDRLAAMRSQGNGQGHRVSERSETPENPLQDTALQRENALLRTIIQDKERLIDDVRQERDAWRQQAERAQHLLGLPARQPPETPPKKRWWSRK